jgi:hypothetical protein
MATLYWGGGAGTWDATTTTNWYSNFARTILAGAAPTLSDDVIFDSASNATLYTVTVGTNAVAQDITIAGPAAGNVTITSAINSVINCYGSWLSAATGVVFTTTSGAALNFLATTTGKTVTTNNVTLGAMIVTFSNSSGGWTLGSAITTTGTFNVTSGTFNTGTNYAINAASYSSSGGTFKSITLNSSTVTTTATGGFQIATTATNLTFSGASSTIICSNGSPTFGGISGLTYGTVQFTSVTLATVTITGANTYTNLTFTSRTADGLGAISFSGDQVVTGTLTVGTGNTAVRRLFIFSSAIGTQRTFTVAAIATLSDVDFRDIIAAGASGTWSGTRLGNCLNNSNITFGAGVTKYFRSVAGASANWGGVVWSTSSLDTATPVVTDFPLAQDTCVIDDAGAVSNNGLRTSNTITVGFSWNIGTLNVGGRTAAFNWTQANLDPTFYGDVTLTTAMTMTTVSGSPTWTFSGQGLTQTINTGGLTLRLSGVVLDIPTGTVSLASNITLELIAGTTGIIQHNFGALALNSYDFYAVNYAGSGSNVRAIDFGTGRIFITTTTTSTAWTSATSTNFTITGSKDVYINGAALAGVTRTISLPTAALGGTEANALNIYVTSGADIITFGTTNRIINNLSFSSFTGSVATNAAPQIYGNLQLSTGMTITAGTNNWSFVATSAGKTITTNGVVFNNPITFDGVGGEWDMNDALTMGSTQQLTFTNGTLRLKSNTFPTTVNTVGSFVTTGTNVKYLQSTVPGTRGTISQASGIVNVSYLSIRDSDATGGATFYAIDPTNVNAGNNTGWIFRNPTGGSGGGTRFGFGFRI